MEMCDVKVGDRVTATPCPITGPCTRTAVVVWINAFDGWVYVRWTGSSGPQPMHPRRLVLVEAA
jgi:hypothetical protein